MDPSDSVFDSFVFILADGLVVLPAAKIKVLTHDLLVTRNLLIFR